MHPKLISSALTSLRERRRSTTSCLSCKARKRVSAGIASFCPALTDGTCRHEGLAKQALGTEEIKKLNKLSLKELMCTHKLLRSCASHLISVSFAALFQRDA